MFKEGKLSKEKSLKRIKIQTEKNLLPIEFPVSKKKFLQLTAKKVKFPTEHVSEEEEEVTEVTTQNTEIASLRAEIESLRNELRLSNKNQEEVVF